MQRPNYENLSPEELSPAQKRLLLVGAGAARVKIVRDKTVAEQYGLHYAERQNTSEQTANFTQHESAPTTIAPVFNIDSARQSVDAALSEPSTRPIAPRVEIDPNGQFTSYEETGWAA